MKIQRAGAVPWVQSLLLLVPTLLEILSGPRKKNCGLASSHIAEPRWASALGLGTPYCEGGLLAEIQSDVDEPENEPEVDFPGQALSQLALQRPGCGWSNARDRSTSATGATPLLNQNARNRP